MQLFTSSECAKRVGPIVQQRALLEIRSRIERKELDSHGLIQGISHLFLTSVLQGDEIGARSHLKAAQYLLGRRGGLGEADPKVVQRLKYGDFHLALATLSPCIFSRPARLKNALPDDLIFDPHLERQARDVLQMSHIYFSGPLYEGLTAIVQCALVVGSLRNCPKSPATMIQWFKDVAEIALFQLLGAEYDPQTTISHRNVWHSTRISLLMWLQILMLLLNEKLDRVKEAWTVGNNALVFGTAKAAAMSNVWPPCVTDGLAKWNNVIRTEAGTTWLDYMFAFANLVDAAERTETLSPVRLREFIRGILDIRDVRKLFQD